MSRLEDFIRKHKNEFDDLEPRPGLWNSIASHIFTSGAQQKTGLWNSLAFWRVAATVLLLLAAGFYFKSLPETSQRELAALEKDFAEIERYYLNQLSEKSSMINNFRKGWSQDDSSQDLLRLEAMYMVLKEEMSHSPSQQVKDALVLNLIVRLDIITKTLEEAESQKEEKSI